ncbi:MAG: hypothetical protein RR620_12580 [Clostridium sp.]|uniref:hypothetical protein n=1 Tax=Anaerorhabdus sp. TaxID=1872524 RepID=UPI002FC677F8
MNNKQFKNQFLELVEMEIGELDVDAKLNLLKRYIFEIELSQEWDKCNSGTSWSDDQLRIVFSFPQSRENCLKLARAFNRGYGSIEQIYRWAVISDKEISEGHQADNKFIANIKKIAKESNWRV